MQTTRRKGFNVAEYFHKIKNITKNLITRTPILYGDFVLYLLGGLGIKYDIVYIYLTETTKAMYIFTKSIQF